MLETEENRSDKQLLFMAPGSPVASITQGPLGPQVHYNLTRCNGERGVYVGVCAPERQIK